MGNEKNRMMGPFLFAIDCSTKQFEIKVKDKVFILAPSLSETVYKQQKISIKLYQDIRRAGYSYLMFLQEIDNVQRICFAIPMEVEIKEQRDMLQWIVSKNPGSMYHEWYCNCLEKEFDENTICGYRIAHNLQQENWLKMTGELL